MSVKELAAAVGREPMTVYRWEWERTEPCLADFEAVGLAVGATAGSLVDGGHTSPSGSAAKKPARKRRVS